MQYSLEDKVEAERLEGQIFQTNYNIEEEIQKLGIKFSGKILDAGSGTGVLSRYIRNHYRVDSVTGIEFSELRIAQGNKLLSEVEKQNISFEQGDLQNINKEHHHQYNHVISRYVLEHIPSPLEAIKELKKCLIPGGKLSILELDGVFFNLFSTNERFNELLNYVKSAVPFDLNIGRKIPNYMKQAGFNNVHWEAQLMVCKDLALKEEYENTKQRFIALRSFLTNIFEDEAIAREFEDLYLKEMMVKENTLTFTKYFCVAND